MSAAQQSVIALGTLTNMAQDYFRFLTKGGSSFDKKLEVAEWFTSPIKVKDTPQASGGSLDGATWTSTGVGKGVWDFTAYVKVTPDAGYMSLAEATALIGDESIANRVLTFQDMFDTTTYSGMLMNKGDTKAVKPLGPILFSANSRYLVHFVLRES